ncbi:nucleic acid/nucleotide deaminase of polymorphic system toxin [Murinocardiopsis flavida]|uniref:Nucleic acid/nucleotide deaminase of polymorphic system toxin n=1 Tax=Murinocardiopsis flavida TaxID=645275 RepID=A0A2P8DHR8_9ACTN|nr:polymorphic toxin-type HINT domain-containing protein [Murinocardiopsis flavida]PSK96770.1 nucleic acid/nucleotide deaminase of polymorphic system toxin [Murinocardiopsis flavida]
MHWVWRAESGAGKIEYGALVILAAVVLAALIASGLPASVTPAVTSAVCELYDADHCDPKKGGPGGPGDGPGAGGDPTAAAADPTGGPTDGPATSGDPGTSGDPALDREIDEAQREYDRLAKEHDQKKGDADQTDKLLIELLKELIGWDKAKDCFTKGDILACLETALTAIPWGKALKVVSKIPKAYKLFDKWRKGSKAYEQAKKRLDDQKKKLDDLKKKRDTKRRAPCLASGNSFVPGTRVRMADGAYAPIESIDVGDAVHAFDPRTGTEGPRTVVDTLSDTGPKELVDLGFTTPGGSGGRVTATAEHPFWAPGTAEWVTAGELAVGTPLRSADGRWPELRGARPRTAPDQRVHNLTVAGLATYYVQVGDSDVLTHNYKCEGLVEYGVDELSKAADKCRRDNAIPAWRNVVAVKVKGRSDYVCGYSAGTKDESWHSEDDVLDRLLKENKNDFVAEDIEELYSDRQPCSRCQKLLEENLHPDAKVKFAVEWPRANDPDFDRKRTQSNERLADMIRGARRGR